jgi:hypothetical protein
VLWHTRPSGIVLQSSRDGKTWQELGGKPWRSGTRVTLWENLNAEARHLRLVCAIAERRHNRKNPEEHIIGISEIEAHPLAVESIAADTATGLVAKSKSGDDLAWLVEPGGRIRFGQLDSEGHFRCIRTRDLEIDLGERATLRLVARDRLAELYVNDHLVDDYDITGCAGQFTVLSAEPATLHAWQPDPKAAPSK